jgi:hypothetical protein
VTDRRKWKYLVRQAKAHSGLWRQWKKKKKKKKKNGYVELHRIAHTLKYIKMYRLNYTEE